MENKKQASGIQKAWRQLSIQNQIFLSMFLITLLGVGVLMNIVYKASVDAIEQNYRASYQSTLKNSSRVLDMNLKNIVDVGRSFSMISLFSRFWKTEINMEEVNFLPATGQSFEKWRMRWPVSRFG